MQFSHGSRLIVKCSTLGSSISNGIWLNFPLFGRESVVIFFDIRCCAKRNG